MRLNLHPTHFMQQSAQRLTPSPACASPSSAARADAGVAIRAAWSARVAATTATLACSRLATWSTMARTDVSSWRISASFAWSRSRCNKGNEAR